MFIDKKKRKNNLIPKHSAFNYLTLRSEAKFVLQLRCGQHIEILERKSQRETKNTLF